MARAVCAEPSSGMYLQQKPNRKFCMVKEVTGREQVPRPLASAREEVGNGVLDGLKQHLLLKRLGHKGSLLQGLRQIRGSGRRDEDEWDMALYERLCHA